MRDYSRQEGIFDQARLRRAKIAVVGTSQLTHYLCTYMAGLGIGNCLIFDGGGEGYLTKKSSSLERRLDEINPDMNVDIISHPFDPNFIGRIDALLDLTNSPESKAMTRGYASRERIFYISSSSSEYKAAVEITVWDDRLGSLLTNKHEAFEDYRGVAQGTATSAVASAIILDEARKKIVKVDGDELKGCFIEYASYAGNRFYFKPAGLSGIVKAERLACRKREGRVLVVGAGGIGTYAALSLSQAGVPIDLYDGDSIDPTNLNRQVFYYGMVGKNKALVLKKRLQNLFSCRINAFARDFTEKDIDNFPKYLAMISCVDNPGSKLLLNRAALENDVPLIDTGVTAFSARLEAFVPGTNDCISCRRGKSYGEREGVPESCASIAVPNIVMCNALIGAMAAEEVLNFQKTGELGEGRFLYLSKKSGKEKFRIADVKRNCGCTPRSGCSCHEVCKK